jgi:hypothetical protein
MTIVQSAMKLLSVRKLQFGARVAVAKVFIQVVFKNGAWPSAALRIAFIVVQNGYGNTRTVRNKSSPYPHTPQAICYPGQFFNNGYVGGATVDEESKVNRYPGYEMTKGKYRHQLPTFQMNMPQVRGWHNADTESNLRWEASFDKKQCTNSTEKSFIPYSFEHFESLCYDPQDPAYIIPEDSFDSCFPNARFWHRAGEPSRFDRVEKYRNGCDYNVKYFPKKLSYSNFGY